MVVLSYISICFHLLYIYCPVTWKPEAADPKTLVTYQHAFLLKETRAQFYWLSLVRSNCEFCFGSGAFKGLDLEVFKNFLGSCLACWQRVGTVSMLNLSKFILFKAPQLQTSKHCFCYKLTTFNKTFLNQYLWTLYLNCWSAFTLASKAIAMCLSGFNRC